MEIILLKSFFKYVLKKTMQDELTWRSKLNQCCQIEYYTQIDEDISLILEETETIPSVYLADKNNVSQIYKKYVENGREDIIEEVILLLLNVKNKCRIELDAKSKIEKLLYNDII